MRLIGSRIPALVEDIFRALVEREMIDVSSENEKEVKLDVKSVLEEYLRAERQLTEEAKDEARERGLDYQQINKVKRQIAERKRFKLYEEAVGYLSEQIIETLLHTQHVDEVFGEDHELRATIAPVLKRHMNTGDGLDLEVRKRIKNLEEGTLDWEIQYKQTLERLKSARGISE